MKPFVTTVNSISEEEQRVQDWIFNEYCSSHQKKELSQCSKIADSY